MKNKGKITDFNPKDERKKLTFFEKKTNFLKYFKKQILFQISVRLSDS